MYPNNNCSTCLLILKLFFYFFSIFNTIKKKISVYDQLIIQCISRKHFHISIFMRKIVNFKSATIKYIVEYLQVFHQYFLNLPT